MRNPTFAIASRVSAFVQQGVVGCVIRLINAKFPSIEELDLPPILKEFVLSKRGLLGQIFLDMSEYFRAILATPW